MMTKMSFSHKKALFFLVFFCNFIIYINGQENKPKPRVNPACALIQSKIYCYGGFTEYQLGDDRRPFYSNALNEHITLDIQTLGTNLSHYNQSLIQWNPVSNTYNGNPLTSLGNAATVKLNDNTYIMYGGSATSSNNNPNLTHPFLHYNPQNDIWDSLPLMPSNVYSSRTQIVNLGDDSIWIWGGTLLSSGYKYTSDYGIFNYKTKSWSNMQTYTASIKIDHTATLAGDGLIYMIGGYYKVNETATMLTSDFKRIFTYDTQRLEWANVDTTGDTPSGRGIHTTTATADGKYLLIYGGAKVIDSGLSVSTDVYFIFDISSKSFSKVELPENKLSSNFNNNRYGHFATLYNSTYLLLSFGYVDSKTPAESFSVLNIANPRQPVWATALNIPDSLDENKGGTDPKILIPAIVVPVVVVLLGAAAGLFFFIRYRKQQRKNAFVLQQEDPRNRDADPFDFMDNATTAVNSDSLGRRSVEVTKPFMMEQNDQTKIVNHNNI
ncbi:unnamed protein product [Cunninghamella echinulata]